MRLAGKPALAELQKDATPVAFDFEYASPAGYHEASILRGSEQEGRAFLTKMGCEVISARPLFNHPQPKAATVPQEWTAVATDLALAAKELAEYASYAEIVGGISTNRQQIREWCDKVFSLFRQIDDMEDPLSAAASLPAQSDKGIARERCRFHVCDEEEEHDPNCRDWPAAQSEGEQGEAAVLRARVCELEDWIKRTGHWEHCDARLHRLPCDCGYRKVLGRAK